MSEEEISSVGNRLLRNLSSGFIIETDSPLILKIFLVGVCVRLDLLAFQLFLSACVTSVVLGGRCVGVCVWGGWGSGVA